MKKSNLLFLLTGVAVFLLILGIVYPKKSVNRQVFPENRQNEEINEENNFSDESDTGEFFLQINSPQNGDTLISPTVNVSGRTKSNADVFVNDLELKADDDGVFSTNLTLEEGENIIVITAGDDEGNFEEKELTVNYEVAE